MRATTAGPDDRPGTRDAKRALAHDCGLLLLSDAWAARSLLGIEERDGASWQVVRAAFAGGGYYDYFLDPGSGAMGWARYTRDADVVWIRYRDWRVVGGPITVGFDLGQGSALALYQAYVERERLLERRAPLSKQRAGGIGGASGDVVATLKTVAFGGSTFTNVPATFVLNPAGSTETTREQGNLGTDILKRFRLIVDYSHDALYLEPDRGAVRAPFRKDRSGLAVELEDATLVVVFVAPGSPAETGGWRVGEKITAVDGEAVGADYSTSDRWRWSQGNAGTRVALTVAGGETRRLTLADYY